MSEQLPTSVSLDEAAKAAGRLNWQYDCGGELLTTAARNSIVAHARTLDLLHGRKPLDPIEAAIQGAWDEWKASYYDGQMGLKQTDFNAACRKHFAGLTFPKGDAA